MSNEQVKNGKAFEFALLNQFQVILSKYGKVDIINDDAMLKSKEFYGSISTELQKSFDVASEKAIHHLLLCEPMLSENISFHDFITLQVQPDSLGIAGDVRDVLTIRKLKNWEIGISVKNNHDAVKHSRLSGEIDFGKKWMNVSCSKNYFSTVGNIFNNLRILQSNGVLWRDLPYKVNDVYVPILDAFILELNDIILKDSSAPTALLQYLVGRKDFYKVIRTSNSVKIEAFNFTGKLNQGVNGIQPQIKIPKLQLPTRIIETVHKDNSKNTVILTFDMGWQVSFRIHNASSLVEPSLKFDIKLEGIPKSLYSHSIVL